MSPSFLNYFLLFLFLLPFFFVFIGFAPPPLSCGWMEGSCLLFPSSSHCFFAQESNHATSSGPHPGPITCAQLVWADFKQSREKKRCVNRWSADVALLSGGWCRLSGVEALLEQHTHDFFTSLHYSFDHKGQGCHCISWWLGVLLLKQNWSHFISTDLLAPKFY